MGIDLDWERDLLAAMLDRDEDIIRASSPVLHRYDFSDPAHAWVWSVVSATWEKCHEAPTATTFRDAARELPDGKRAGFVRVLLKLADRKPQGPAQALEAVRRYLSLAAGRKAVIDGLEAIEDGDMDEVEEALAEGLLRMRQAKTLEEERSASDDFDGRMKRYMGDIPAHERIRIRTPLKVLDRWLGGGPFPGAFCLVASPSNVGKSAFAVDLGHAALVYSDAVVLHFTTEETKATCDARYDARFSGVSKGRLLGEEPLTEIEQARIAKAARRMASIGGKRLYVKEIDPGTPVSAIPAIAMSIRQKHPTEPLVVIVDLIDDLRPVRSTDQGYVNVRDTVIPLVAMALDKRLGRCVVWATTQAGRKVKRDKGVVSPDQIGEGHDKFKKATVVLSLFEIPNIVDDDEDDDENEDEADLDDEGPVYLGVRLIKNRLSRVSRGVVHTVADLGCCRFRECDERDYGKDPEGAA